MQADVGHLSPTQLVMMDSKVFELSDAKKLRCAALVLLTLCSARSSPCPLLSPTRALTAQAA